MPASVIIGIHGLANKPPNDPPQETKKNWWRCALIEGLQRNCSKTTDDLDFDFVYWADLRYPKPIPLLGNPEPYYPAQGTGNFPSYHVSKWAKIFNEAATVIGDGVNLLDMHTGVSDVGTHILECQSLADLGEYYKNEEFRSETRKRLMGKIQAHAGKRIMLIAHSMGSIIAYDVLRLLGRQTPSLPVDHFVTIGSPLGIPHVKYKIYMENDLVRTPSVVGRWTNFADRRDIVAVEANLAVDYEANDQAVKVVDVPVNNAYVSPPDRNPPNKPNYHKSYGYLRTPELSNLVRGFY